MGIIWCGFLRCFWIWKRKKIAHAFRIKSSLKIFKNFAWADSKNFILIKFATKFWFRKYIYCIYMTHTWVINRGFSKMSHDSLLTTTSDFREVEKPACVDFWRGSWWDTEKIEIIRFCIHETKMAFETPFVPRGLHF